MTRRSWDDLDRAGFRAWNVEFGSLEVGIEIIDVDQAIILFNR